VAAALVLSCNLGRHVIVSKVNMRMNLSRLSLIAAVVMGTLAAGTTITLAQDTNSTPPAHGKKGSQLKEQFQKIAEELQLTEQQKEESRPIFRDFFEKAKSIHQDTSLDQQQRREKIKDLRQDVAAKLKGILTPEQLQKWQAMRETAHQKKQSN
jgi:Spy/CpxP family protein refolding chaperone